MQKTACYRNVIVCRVYQYGVERGIILPRCGKDAMLWAGFWICYNVHSLPEQPGYYRFKVRLLVVDVKKQEMAAPNEGSISLRLISWK